MVLDFKENYILENEKVLLRPLETSDAEYLREYSEREPDIWQFNAGGADGIDNLIKYIDRAVQQKLVGKEYAFIVFDKRDQKYVGATRLYDYVEERKIIKVGYTWYGKRYQGTHVNKNCKYLLLDFAFDKLALERVGFGANEKNERSISAMKSIGCTVEGLLRNFGMDGGGGRINTLVLSILRDEWEKRLKKQLQEKIELYGHGQLL